MSSSASIERRSKSIGHYQLVAVSVAAPMGSDRIGRNQLEWRKCWQHWQGLRIGVSTWDWPSFDENPPEEDTAASSPTSEIDQAKAREEEAKADKNES